MKLQKMYRTFDEFIVDCLNFYHPKLRDLRYGLWSRLFLRAASGRVKARERDAMRFLIHLEFIDWNGDWPIWENVQKTMREDYLLDVSVQDGVIYCSDLAKDPDNWEQEVLENWYNKITEAFGYCSKEDLEKKYKEINQDKGKTRR